MEQSRPVYEEASNQLGYFLELISNPLPLSPYGTEMGRTDAARGRSRTMVSEDASLSSIASLHSRRKSTSCTNTQTRKQKSSHKLRSISTDCASDTSSMSQAVETRSLPRYRNIIDMQLTRKFMMDMMLRILVLELILKMILKLMILKML